jgi:hypothetical protein
MPYTPRSELFDCLKTVFDLADKIDGSKVESAQDAMINMRIDWEEIQLRLKSRKFEGFEPVIAAMKQLIATTLVMTASLQAKLLSQREQQLMWEEKEEQQKQETVAKRTRKKKALAV